jgi:hypothetical protein
MSSTQPAPSDKESAGTEPTLRYQPSGSRFVSVSSHPLIVAICGIVVGALVTQSYAYWQKNVELKRTAEQQELFREHSFSDELNKISILKLGEVWERIDENELMIDGLLGSPATAQFMKPNPESNDKRVDDLQRLIRQDKSILNKNKFWVGEELYKKTDAYLDIHIKYGINKILSGDIDLDELKRNREAAKSDLLNARSIYLHHIQSLIFEVEKRSS